MNTISKFIINRNNLCYIYAEKRLVNNESVYYIYCDSNSYNLPSHHFHSIFGNDKKISIEDFLISAETNVVSYDLDNARFAMLYSKINKLLKEVKGKNKKNPSLWGYSYEFCNLLDEYNSFIYELIKKNGNVFACDDIINYEEEYQRLIKQEL